MMVRGAFPLRIPLGTPDSSNDHAAPRRNRAHSLLIFRRGAKTARPDCCLAADPAPTYYPPADAVWDPPGVSVDMIAVTAFARVTSPESVAAVFAEAARTILGKRKGRGFEPRSIEVVGFVEREARMKADTLTSEQWADLWRKWNRNRPQRYARKQSPLPRSRREKLSRPARFRTPREMREAYRRTRASFFPDEPR
jgi:hypothetical protein